MDPLDIGTERRHRISIAQIRYRKSYTKSGDNDPSNAEEGSQEVFRRKKGEHSQQSSVVEKENGATGNLQSQTSGENENRVWSKSSSSRNSLTHEHKSSPEASTSAITDVFVTKRKKRQPRKSSVDSGETKSKLGKGICCPKGFQPLAVSTAEKPTKEKRKERKKFNPYSKSKYLYNLTNMFDSSDSDFQ